MDHSTFSTRMRRWIGGDRWRHADEHEERSRASNRGARDGQAAPLISPVEHGAILEAASGIRVGSERVRGRVEPCQMDVDGVVAMIRFSGRFR